MIDDCHKLTAYLGERKRSGHALAADTLMRLYGAHGIAASILLRGVEGFGRRHQLRSDSSLSLSEDLPAVAIAVDRPERLAGLQGEVATIVGSGLVTLERAGMPSGEQPEAALPPATKLTAYLRRRDRAGALPAHVAVCELLHRRGIDGATTLLGVDGTRFGERERARFFARNADVPAMVLAVGAGDRLAALLPEIRAIVGRAPMTVERVRVCKSGGRLLDRPENEVTQAWQKLTVYTSEAQLHAGRPIHREITRRLRGHGALGVTTVRGIWGFHGSHLPHGDRFLQLGRHVPTVTVLIDVPERIAASFEVIDELTAEHGLVTCEEVPSVLSGSR